MLVIRDACDMHDACDMGIWIHRNVNSNMGESLPYMIALFALSPPVAGSQLTSGGGDEIQLVALLNMCAR